MPLIGVNIARLHNEGNVPLFSRMISTLAISTGGEGNANGGDGGGGGGGGGGRRSSSLHNSFGRQPEILETYIYAASRPRGVAETGWRGDRAARVAV